MISYLDGISAGSEDDGAITVVAHGVGYRVVMSDLDQELAYKKGVGAEMRVFTRTIASENDISIYGFFDSGDRRAFDRLIKVKGVGCITALRILSLHHADALKVLLDTKDSVALCKIPSVGKKTAQTLIDKVKL